MNALAYIALISHRMSTLKGKTALITGASRGLGVFLAESLAEKGANLVLAARSAGRLDTVAKNLAQHGVEVLPYPADISDPVALAVMLEKAIQRFGSVDILVNNAAIEQTSAYAEEKIERIQDTLHTNLHAPLNLNRLVLPQMLAKKSGHIINIASVAGKKGLPYNALYSASKAGLIEWTNAMQFELEGTGVHASVLCLGFISDAGKFARDGLKAPRWVGASHPREVAGALLKVLDTKKAEVYVSPAPLRFLMAINALFPEFGNWVVKKLGIVDMFRGNSKATS